MQLSRSARVGAWILIALNLLMAFGAIGVFMRMAPAIAVIIDRNERSLEACEEMLASLVRVGFPNGRDDPQAVFEEALRRAKRNISEDGEQEVLVRIERSAPAAMQGQSGAVREITEAITDLSRINRHAMRDADQHAQQLGRAGAWGVVFMAVAIFVATMVFLRAIRRRVVEPLEEIYEVVVARRDEGGFRRCSGTMLLPEIRAIYGGINQLMDRSQATMREGQSPSREELGSG